MGFTNDMSSVKTTYARLSSGHVTLSSKSELPDYVSRTNKIGNQIWEKTYKTYTGKLVDVRTVDGDYGVYWVFEFDDNGETVIISSSYDNRYTRTLLNRLLNKAIDFSEPITIAPYSFVPEGETYTLSGTNVIQFGKKINPRWDIKKELVQPEEIIIKKVKTYNYEKQLQFFEEMVAKELKPRLEGSREVKPNIIPTDKDGFINIEDDIEEKEVNLYDGLE